jgi:hypothetical protein
MPSPWCESCQPALLISMAKSTCFTLAAASGSACLVLQELRSDVPENALPSVALLVDCHRCRVRDLVQVKGTGIWHDTTAQCDQCNCCAGYRRQHCIMRAAAQHLSEQRMSCRKACCQWLRSLGCCWSMSACWRRPAAGFACSLNGETHTRQGPI